jgi:hypothetical protein
VDLFTSSGLHGHRSVLVSTDAPARVVAWFEQRKGSAIHVDETSWTWRSVSRFGAHTELRVESIDSSHQPAIRNMPARRRSELQTAIVEEVFFPPRRPWWKFW